MTIEATYCGHACFLMEGGGHRLIIDPFLTGNPKATLAAIYDFLGEPAFDHDFEHIEYDDRGFDAKAGTPGLHAVRSRIESSERQTILPPDLFQRFANDAFWENPASLPKGMRIV